VRPPAANAPAGTVLTGLRDLLRRLLDRLDLQRQLDLVAHQHAAGLQRLVPLQAELAPVDAGRCAEARALAAPGVLAGAS
jgi:hypothetical protein